jgi:8-oxo-dGTP pyrophosphatase MutT (NUDIX family)
MPLEFSAGAVIFRKEKNKTLYLVLKYEEGHWDFVKGHIGDNIKGEKAEEAVIRESEEEAGITDLGFVEGFKNKIHYFLRKEGKTYFKTVTFFLAETKQKKIKLSFEHVGYKWLGYEDALKQLTYDNAKIVLEKANSFLKKVKR